MNKKSIKCQIGEKVSIQIYLEIYDKGWIMFKKEPKGGLWARAQSRLAEEIGIQISDQLTEIVNQNILR